MTTRGMMELSSIAARALPRVRQMLMDVLTAVDLLVAVLVENVAPYERAAGLMTVVPFPADIRAEKEPEWNPPRRAEGVALSGLGPPKGMNPVKDDHKTVTSIVPGISSASA